MKNRIHRGLLLASAATCLISFAGEAQAQSAPAEDQAADIIVTARRSEERLQDVPISMTVFSQEQVTNRNLLTSKDLATYTPSLSIDQRFGGENTSFSMRGFVQDIGTAPTVGVYFADVVAPRGGAQTLGSGDGAGPGSFFDLQNVQVLKGPQGTLFGRNTTGGAILFVPQKPTGEFQGYLEGSIGNYDMRRLQGAINIPLSDTFKVRLSGDRTKRDGWLKNVGTVGPKAFNDIDYYTLRGSVVADLTPDLENYTIASYTHSDTNGGSGKIIDLASNIAAAPSTAVGAILAGDQFARLGDPRAAGTGFYTAATSLPNQGTKLTQWQIINTTTWRASDNLTVKNIASYGELKNVNRIGIFGDNFRLAPLAGFVGGSLAPALANPNLPPEQRAALQATVNSMFNLATNPAYANLPVYFALVNPPGNTSIADQSTFTEELQFQGESFDGRLNWQAGAYYEKSSPLGTTGAASASNFLSCTSIDSANPQCIDPLRAFGSPAGLFGASTARTSTRSAALYAQGTFDITEQLKATLGLRYTWDKQTFEYFTNTIQRFLPFDTDAAPPFPGPVSTACNDTTRIYPNCAQKLSSSDNAPTWVVGLDYKPTDDLMVYAKYARGYRTGGIAGALAPPGNQLFGPEKLDSYEAGLKASFRGAVSGFFNIAGFYNDFSDQQLQVGYVRLPLGTPGVGGNGIANAGKSRIYGVEIDGSISPFKGFAIDGSYAYLNTEIRSINLPPIVDSANFAYSVGQAKAGFPLTFTPKHKATVTARYTLPLSESVGEVTLGATYTYVDEQVTSYAYFDPAIFAAYGNRNLGIVPSYNLLNLNVNWNSVAGSPVDLALFATNVTKEKYYTVVSGIAAGGFESAQLGEPRMYGVRIRYNFGN